MLLVHNKLIKTGAYKGKQRDSNNQKSNPMKSSQIQFLSRLVMDSKTGVMRRARYAVRSMCTVLDLSVSDVSWVTWQRKLISKNRQGITLVSHSFSKESFSDLFASPFSLIGTLNIVLLQGWVMSLLFLFTYVSSRISLIKFHHFKYHYILLTSKLNPDTQTTLLNFKFVCIISYSTFLLSSRSLKFK